MLSTLSPSCALTTSQSSSAAEKQFTMEHTVLAPKTAEQELIQQPATTSSNRTQEPWTRYTKHELLGQGACKKVYKAFDEEEGLEVAWNEVTVTEFNWSSERERERVFAEIKLLKQLKHKNILALHDWWFDRKNSTLIFISELFIDGTLRQYRRRHKNVDVIVIKRWAWQILQGLVYLHGHNPPIIHRDLKSDNIFINGTSGQVKLGDLGFATFLSGFSVAMSVIGTPEFMAPELYEERYNEKVDVYSFGMCLMELATLEYPYSECRNPAQIFKKVTQGIPPQGVAKIQDQELKEFVNLCIQHDPEKRPEARQLLKHPFFDCIRPTSEGMRAKATPGLPPSLPSANLSSHLQQLLQDSARNSPRGSQSGSPTQVPHQPQEHEAQQQQQQQQAPYQAESDSPLHRASSITVAVLPGAQASVTPIPGAMAHAVMSTQPVLHHTQAGIVAGPVMGGAIAAAVAGQPHHAQHAPAAENGSQQPMLAQPMAAAPALSQGGQQMLLGAGIERRGSPAIASPFASSSNLGPEMHEVDVLFEDGATRGAVQRVPSPGVGDAPYSPTVAALHRLAVTDHASQHVPIPGAAGGGAPAAAVGSADDEEEEGLLGSGSPGSNDPDTLAQRVRLACRSQQGNMLAFSMSFVNHRGTRKKVGFQYDMSEDTAQEVATEMVENLSLNVDEASFIANLIQQEIHKYEESRQQPQQPQQQPMPVVEPEPVAPLPKVQSALTDQLAAATATADVQQQQQQQQAPVPTTNGVSGSPPASDAVTHVALGDGLGHQEVLSSAGGEHEHHDDESDGDDPSCFF